MVGGFQSQAISPDPQRTYIPGLLRHSRSFKVIEFGTNRKPVCDFLLVINSNWHPISYRFAVIAAYCSHFLHCVFEPPFGGLEETTYDVHLGLIGYTIVRSGLTISVNWTFFARCYVWGATSESRSESGDFAPTQSFSLQRSHFDPKFQVEGVAHHQSFLHG